MDSWNLPVTYDKSIFEITAILTDSTTASGTTTSSIFATSHYT